MKKASCGAAHCPVARSVASIGDVWSLLIIRDAIGGLRRFGEFQKSLGLAKNILSVRLRQLVAGGILRMAPASDGSAYQEYVPTEAGYDLVAVVVALGEWGNRWLAGPDEARHMLVERRTGLPIAPLALRSQDGRTLSAQELGPSEAYLKLTSAHRSKSAINLDHARTSQTPVLEDSPAS